MKSAERTYLNAYMVEYILVTDAVKNKYNHVVVARSIRECEDILTLLYAEQIPTITRVEMLGCEVFMESVESEKHGGNLAF